MPTTRPLARMSSSTFALGFATPLLLTLAYSIVARVGATRHRGGRDPSRRHRQACARLGAAHDAAVVIQFAGGINESVIGQRRLIANIRRLVYHGGSRLPLVTLLNSTKRVPTVIGAVVGGTWVGSDIPAGKRAGHGRCERITATADTRDNVIARCIQGKIAIGHGNGKRCAKEAGRGIAVDVLAESPVVLMARTR